MSNVLTIHGGKPLKGSVTVRGAKNLVPKAMVAALLRSKPTVIRNVRPTKDVEFVAGLLRVPGVTVEHNLSKSLSPYAVQRTWFRKLWSLPCWAPNHR